jgi:hypothetical protein
LKLFDGGLDAPEASAAEDCGFGWHDGWMLTVPTLSPKGDKGGAPGTSAGIVANRIYRG